MEFIPIIILFGSALAGFACFQFYRPYLYVLANFPGAFLVFAAGLTGCTWIYEHLSRYFGVSHPFGLEPGMQGEPMPFLACAGYAILSIVWYAVAVGIRARYRFRVK